MFNLEETLKASKLDYTVSLKPVTLQVSEGLNVPTRFYGTYNETNGEIYRTSFTNYNVIQNFEAFEVLNKVHDYFPELEVVKAGSFDLGRKAFISVNLGSYNVGNNTKDRLDRTLTVFNSHDGQSNVHFSASSIRIACKNQLAPMFAGSFADYSHTQLGKLKMDKEAVGVLLDTFMGNFKKNEELFNKLANTRISREHVLASIAKLLLKDSKDLSSSKTTRIKKKVDIIVGNLHNADNGLIAKNTGWNLFNSIQGMFQHSPELEPKDLDQSVLEGTISKQSLEALKVVSEVCTSDLGEYSSYLLNEEIEALTGSYNMSFLG